MLPTRQGMNSQQPDHQSDWATQAGYTTSSQNGGDMFYDTSEPLWSANTYTF